MVLFKERTPAFHHSVEGERRSNMMLLLLAVLATFITLVIPVVCWFWYAFKTPRGWLYLLIGFALYLILQLILRLSFLLVFNFLLDFSAGIPALLTSFLNILLNAGGLFLVYWVFYRPKITVEKAVGLSIGFGFFECVILFGANCLLSILLELPLPAASYSGAIIEGTYLSISMFCLSALIAYSLQENNWRSLIITLVIYVLFTLLNPLILSLVPSLLFEWVLLLVESVLWIWLFIRFGKEFYRNFFTELFPFLSGKKQKQ